MHLVMQVLACSPGSVGQHPDCWLSTAQTASQQLAWVSLSTFNDVFAASQHLLPAASADTRMQP